MDFQVEFSERAREELNEIVERIEKEYDNPQAAERFFVNVQQKAVALAHNPFLYPLCFDERIYEKGYRRVIVGNYIIIYSIDEENELVFIRAIIYGRRDIGSIVN